MKSLLIVGCFILAVVQFAYSAYAGDITAQRYRLTRIKDIPHAEFPMAEDINNKGEILLATTLTTDRLWHSYIWSGKVYLEVGSLGDKNPNKPDRASIRGTFAHAMNDKGQVVGISWTKEGPGHAFLWDKGKIRDLGTLGGGKSEAWDINNTGQVVGRAENARGEDRAFLWEAKGGMRDLGVIDAINTASAINDKGQVIGVTDHYTTSFLWQNDKYIPLKITAPTGFTSVQGSNINDKGEMLGVFHRGGPHSGESRVFLYSNDAVISVEPPQTSKNCNALGISSSGLVVGNAFNTPTGQHAFVWQDGKSALLNDLIAPNLGWDIYFTKTVNDKGEIAASGKFQGKKYLVLLTPKQ